MPNPHYHTKDHSTLWLGKVKNLALFNIYKKQICIYFIVKKNVWFLLDSFFLFFLEYLLNVLSPVFLVIQSLVKRPVRGFSNVLFYNTMQSKQNICEALYKAAYEALND